jgi:hypothetical protein
LWPLSADLSGDLGRQEQSDDSETHQSLDANGLHIRIS